MLTEDPNTNLSALQRRYLSNGKCDKANNPSMRSCMLRVPDAFNFKCKAAGIDAEVKIIQKWDGHRPDYRLLIGSFYADLAGRKKQTKRTYKATSRMRDYVPGHRLWSYSMD